MFLHGRGTDPDGDAIVSFMWTAPSRIHLIMPKSPVTFFIAPEVAAETQVTISLVVTDALGLPSAADTVVVTVRPRF